MRLLLGIVVLLIVMAPSVGEATTKSEANASKLVAMAKVEFKELTSGEILFLKMAAIGLYDVQFTVHRVATPFREIRISDQNTISNIRNAVGEKALDKCRINLALLFWLLTDKDSVECIHPTGVSAYGFAFYGDWPRVSFSNVEVSVPLRFDHCYLSGVKFSNVVMKSLDISNCVLESCAFDGVHCSGSVSVVRSSITGGADYSGAVFGGLFNFNGSRLYCMVDLGRSCINGVFDIRNVKASSAISLVDSYFGCSIYADGSELSGVIADRVRVDGAIHFRNGFKSSAEIDITSSVVNNNVDFSGAEVSSSSGYAIDMAYADIGGYVFLGDGFRSIGPVNAEYVSVDGDFYAPGAVLSSNGHIALNLYGATVRGDVSLINGFRSDGMVQLSSSNISGRLDCNDSEFVNQDGDSFRLEHATVGGSFFFCKSRAAGRVYCLGANVSGGLVFNESVFVNHRGVALCLDGVISSGSVYFDNGVRVFGCVSLAEANVINVYFRGSSFYNQDGCVLDLSSMLAKGDVEASHGATFYGYVNLSSAKIMMDVFFSDSSFVNEFGVSIDMSNICIGHDLITYGKFDSCGVFEMLDADIGNMIYFRGHYHGAQIDDSVIEMSRARVGGGVIVSKGTEILGEWCLLDTHVEGKIRADGARFINLFDFMADDARFDYGKYSIDARRLKCDGPLLFQGWFTVFGKVNLQGAKVAEELKIVDAVDPELAEWDLRHATVGTLYDKDNSWPAEGKLHLCEFQYGHFHHESPKSFEDRLKWLSLVPKDEFDSQPYSHLSKVFKSMGNRDDAKKILYELSCQADKYADMSMIDAVGRAMVFEFGPLYSIVLRNVIGYGHKPWRAFYYLVGVFVFGCFVFYLGWKYQIIKIKSVNPVVFNAYRYSFKKAMSKQTAFNPVMYSLDTLIPIINLRYSELWVFDSSSEQKFFGALLPLYQALHTMAGWVLVTFFAASMTGLVSYIGN